MKGYLLFMNKIKILVFNKNNDKRLESMVAWVEEVAEVEQIRQNHFENLSLEKEKLLFAVSLDAIGSNQEVMQLIRSIKEQKKSFVDSHAAILITSENDLYTKTFAQQMTFLLNLSGVEFIGQPLIEVVDDYQNYRTWQKLYKEKTLKEINLILVEKLVDRLAKYTSLKKKHPKILALHASSYTTSNTLKLWEMVKENLDTPYIKEHQIEEVDAIDCTGCPFEVCLHYAEINSCYYGGVIVEDILPAIEAADYVVWICPNYNDAISAKLMAVINRMTVLYRRISLTEKAIYSIIVSGNSGSDAVAKQLISALNFNKGFRLPGNFALREIANDPGSILEVPNIQKKAEDFAKKINEF